MKEVKKTPLPEAPLELIEHFVLITTQVAFPNGLTYCKESFISKELFLKMDDELRKSVLEHHARNTSLYVAEAIEKDKEKL